MNQRKRMTYVLTSLAGAMFSTAGLLAWMAPALPTLPEDDQSSGMLGIARSLVTKDERVQQTHWQRVEIVPQSPTEPASMIFPSDPFGGDYHYFIDGRGGLSRAGAGRGRHVASRHPGTVRVRLARSVEGALLTDRQARALTSLLKALGEVVSPRSPLLPVRGDSGFVPVQRRASSSRLHDPRLVRVAG